MILKSGVRLTSGLGPVLASATNKRHIDKYLQQVPKNDNTVSGVHYKKIKIDYKKARV